MEGVIERRLCMNITNVTVRPVFGKSRLRGVASIVIDDAVKIRDMPIFPKGESEELSVKMPSKKMQDGHRIYFAYPVTQESREQIEKVVLEEYHRVLAMGKETLENETEMVPRLHMQAGCCFLLFQFF